MLGLRYNSEYFCTYRSLETSAHKAAFEHSSLLGIIHLVRKYIQATSAIF